MDNIKKNSVLVVDDEASNIIALTHILDGEYTVYGSKDGSEAILLAEEYLPDVILLDILMPDMNGYELLSQLLRNERTRDIPVIFISGLVSNEDEEKGLSLGATDYITKPFHPAIVKLRVRKVIQTMNLIKTIDSLRAEAVREAKEQNELNQIMFDNAPIGLTVFDDNFKYIDCNEVVLKMYGITRVVYSTFFGSADHSPEYQPDGAKSYDKAMKIIKQVMDGEVIRIEWVHQTPDGKPLPVELTMIRAKQGDKYVGLGYIYDMRDQVRLKTEIESALVKTQEASRAKSDFLSRMSHEMRTPMNAIMGITQIAKTSCDPGETLDYLNRIEVSSRELLRLIDDVLDITSVEYDTFKLVASVFEFNAMIRDILQMISRSATEKRLTFAYDISPSIPARLIGDEKRLKQAVINLLANAVKFTQENGKVRLAIQRIEAFGENITLQFEVSDTGIGIPKEKHNEIFYLFEQADGGLTRKHGGIGIGLPLSKRIIEMMGGELRLESEPGKGSTFTFTCKLKKVL